MAASKGIYSPTTTASTIDPVLANLDSVALRLPASPLSSLCRGVIARVLKPSDLKRYVSQINTSDDLGRSPLRFAVEFASIDIASELIALGADVNSTDVDGISPIKVAARTGDLEMLEILLKAGKVKLDAGGDSTQPPLFIACSYMNWSAALLLMSHGANVNAVHNGQMLLHVSVEHCAFDRTAFLSELLSQVLLLFS